MNLSHIHLLTNNFVAQREFYTQTFGLPLITSTADSFTLRLGASTLTFTETNSEHIYHFAFNIPQNQLAEGHAWLKARVSIRVDDDQEIVYFKSWNAHAVYYIDPGGNIGELIARHNLTNDSAQPFDVNSLLSVSEIGLTVDDVPATVARLRAELGLAVYANSASEEFAAIGDEHGLFIVVKRGRLWYMSDNAQAQILPLTVNLASNSTLTQTASALQITNL